MELHDWNAIHGEGIAYTTHTASSATFNPFPPDWNAIHGEGGRVRASTVAAYSPRPCALRVACPHAHPLIADLKVLRQSVKVSRLLSQYAHQGLRRAALRLSQSEGLSPSGCRACRERRRLRCLRLPLSKGPRRRPPSRAPLLTPALRRSPRPFLCLPFAPRGTAEAPRPASIPALGQASAEAPAVPPPR